MIMGRAQLKTVETAQIAIVALDRDRDMARCKLGSQWNVKTGI